MQVKFEEITGNYNTSEDSFYKCVDTETNRTVAKIYPSRYNMHALELILFTKNNEEVIVHVIVDGELDKAKQYITEIVRNGEMRLYSRYLSILREES